MDGLPDDVWYIVFSHLEAARDLRGLALACRRLHALVELEGWRIFARSRFPSLDVSSAVGQLRRWKDVADSLTWQSKHWDRRSLHFTLLRRDGRRRRAGLMPCQTTLDARYTPSGAEVAVFGIGEKVVARYRQPREGWTDVAWHQLDGAAQGFRPGRDDVKAVALVTDARESDGLALLVGRDSGGLTLHSGGPENFGGTISSLDPSHASECIAGVMPGTFPQQNTVNSLDIMSDGSTGHVAATTNDGIFFYRLPEEHSSTVPPLAFYDLKQRAFEDSGIQLRAAKWMGSGDTLAIAVKGPTNHALRYLSLTPAGWTDGTVVKTAEFEQRMCHGDGHLCPNSLQPVRQSPSDRGTNLLLSSWRDGTCRLQDLRTPSAFDQVYQDFVDPWAEMEALMVYGTERFVGGGLHGATIKVFDFRWTKNYYYTSALPCSASTPFPEPRQPVRRRPIVATAGAADALLARCYASPLSSSSSRRCRWHELARDLYYRPNASFFLSKALPKEDRGAGVGVWSLARAADFAPAFYVGVSGGVIEARLQQQQQQSRDEASGSAAAPDLLDPHLGLDDPYRRNDGGYAYLDLDPGLMETGDGSVYPVGDRSVRLPQMRGRAATAARKWWAGGATAAGTPREGRPLAPGPDPLRREERHRLDSRFQLEEDFADFSPGV